MWLLRQASGVLSRCVWDETLMVGSCCEEYIDYQCSACDSGNLEFSDAAVRCLDCGTVATEEASEVRIAPFTLTSPTEMPRLESIRIRPVRSTASGVAGVERRNLRLTLPWLARRHRPRCLLPAAAPPPPTIAKPFPQPLGRPVFLPVSTAGAAENQRRKCDEIEINLCSSSQTVDGDIADYHSLFWTSVASLAARSP
jgi:hypothetical protein